MLINLKKNVTDYLEKINLIFYIKQSTIQTLTKA